MQFEVSQAVEVLSATPSTLRAFLGKLSDDWTATQDQASWQPYDVIGHLIHGEETDWIPRARIILDQGEARPFDRYNRFAQVRESGGRSLAVLLSEFDRLRRDNLAV